MAIESVKNLFAVAELRKRVLFTLGMLVVYRIGGHITIPGVNLAALAQLAQQARGTMFGLYDMFSGNNLSKMTIFALGIMPYISASIILQLLTVVWPFLERISKEGELGPPQDHAVHALRHDPAQRHPVDGHRHLARAIDARFTGGLPLVYSPGWGFRLMTVLTLTTGTTLIMWLGEQITERGIGNGMSLIIYAGIVVGLPAGVGHDVRSAAHRSRWG
jgi:preprotein translocase subunit SecY